MAISEINIQVQFAVKFSQKFLYKLYRLVIICLKNNNLTAKLINDED